jgi:hypothetical protein
MITWTSDELDKIGNAEGLRLATQRPDSTLRNPVTIWIIRHGDDLYIRSYRGPSGSWFRHAWSAAKAASRPAGWTRTSR